MEEWKEYKLGDITSKIGSGATPKGGKESYLGGDIALIRSQNILDFAFTNSGLAYINKDQASKLNNVEVKENDILLNITGDSVARACIVPQKILPARVNQHVAIIRGNDIIDNKYLLYYLQHIKPHLLSLSQGGATRNALTKKMLEDLDIKIPSKNVQNIIVSVLSSLDDKIELNRRINENLEQQAQALFKSWFVDFEPFKDGKFVDSELGMIPEGWKVSTIGNYSKIRSGFAFKSSWWTDKGVKIVKIKNISSSGYLDMSDCSYVSKENTLKAKDFSLKPGDLLIAMTGATIGKFCIVPILKEEMYVNQRVGKFFLGEEPILKVPFIYGLLKSENIISQIINKGQGSAQPNISTNDIETTSIILPPEDIISKYNELVSPYFSLLIKNLNECDYLAQLRDILLPKLMSGELQI